MLKKLDTAQFKVCSKNYNYEFKTFSDFHTHVRTYLATDGFEYPKFFYVCKIFLESFFQIPKVQIEYFSYTWIKKRTTGSRSVRSYLNKHKINRNLFSL